MSERVESQASMTTTSYLNRVEASEFSMEFNGGGVVCLSGFDGVYEISEVDCFPIGLNLGVIRFLTSLHKKYANEPGCVVSLPSPIHLILRASRFPEILFSAIKPIAINVVDVFFGKAHDKTVEVYGVPIPSALRDVSHRVTNSSAFRDEPFKAANKFRIFIVDQCRVAFSQWNRNHNSILANLTEMETNPPGIKMKLKEA